MNANSNISQQIEDAYPLSTLQAGMLFHSEYSPETAVYHDIFSYGLVGPYDANKLEEAVIELVANHPLLRTSFNLSDFSEPLQLVNKKVQVALTVEDLRHLPFNEQEKVLQKWIEREKQSPFNWSQAPLFRLQVHRLLAEKMQISLSFHHSILDGWSVAVMMTELFKIYLAKLGKIVYESTSPPVKFREFIVLERQALESEDCRNFWLDKLTDSPFTKIPRWPVESVHKGYQLLNVSISADLSDRLHELAKSLEVPLKDVLLAAHLRVVSLITGELDIVTGLVTNGRPEKDGGERVLGLFLNTLPFRMDLTEGTWAELIKQTFSAEQRMLPFRHYPLAEMSRILKKPVLFEIFFNFINFHVYQKSEGTNQNVQASEVAAFEQTNFPFLVQFSLEGKKKRLRLQLNYDTAQFSEAQLEAISGYFLTTLKTMVEEPEASYRSKSLISEAEQQKIFQWKGSLKKKFRDLCLHQLFAEQVNIYPENIALLTGQEKLTYHQLNNRANQLAHYLQKLGVGPEVLVGLYLERSVEFIISVLAIWKAGAAYLPLDPVYPEERVAFILRETQVPVILTKSELRKRLPKTKAKVVRLDRQWKNIQKHTTDNPAIAGNPTGLAYVIYTSGSTGKPKGVLLNHQGLSNVVQFLKQTFQIRGDDRILQLASVSFDVSVGEIALALGTGATLCLSEEKLLIGPDLLKILHQYQITIGSFTPAPLASLPLSELPDLRIVFTSGDLCTKELVDNWSAGRQFFNLYGPTETTIWSTFYECQKSTKRPPIGRPFVNVEHYILDSDQRLVPVGVPGELYIGGVCLARGYLKRPELTTKLFIPHPFSSEPGARLYKTGDLARYLPDGNIEYIGRSDNQVKIRGFRIELGEIEHVLIQHPDIEKAVVLLREDHPGDKRLVAYLVLEPNKKFDQTKLRQYLHDILPDYMLPAVFIPLAILPLTANGKIDKNVLPLPAGLRPELARNFLAPRTPTEKRLATIWREILKIDRVGIYDNFFELGGHSLAALQVIMRIRQEFQNEIPLKTLFTAPSIEQLALVIVQEKSQNEALDDVERLLTEVEEMTAAEVERLIEPNS